MKIISIPFAIENTALLAALIHPNHIVYRGSLGFSRLPPPRGFNGEAYILTKKYKDLHSPCFFGVFSLNTDLVHDVRRPIFYRDVH